MEQTGAVPEIEPEDLKAPMDADGKKLNISNVREPYEFDISRLEGAVLIPLRNLTDHVNELDSSKGDIFHCRSHARSAGAIGQLQTLGFKKLKNRRFGINAFADAAPSVPKY